MASDQLQTMPTDGGGKEANKRENGKCIKQTQFVFLKLVSLLYVGKSGLFIMIQKCHSFIDNQKKEKERKHMQKSFHVILYGGDPQ